MKIVILLVLLALLMAIFSTFLPSQQAEKRSGTKTRRTRSKASPATRRKTAEKPFPDSGLEDDGLLDKIKERISDCRQAPVDSDLPIAWEVRKEKQSNVLHVTTGMADLLQSRQSILNALNSSKYDPKKAALLVEKDPALVSQILRRVNSPYYGLTQKVASVFRAMLFLGYLEVRHIIWRTCMAESASSVSEEARELFGEIWNHSYSVSRVAFLLAKSFGLIEPDRISTTALLHDIGKLIYLLAEPELGKQLYQSLRFSDHDLLVQEERLGTNHACLGEQIARVWGLPVESAEVIRHHHAPSYIDPDDMNDARVASATATVHIADLLCHCAEDPDTRRNAENLYLPRPAWLRLLGVKTGLEGCLTADILQVTRGSASSMVTTQQEEPVEV